MPAPLITLTTDIGSKDHLVGAMKGQLLQHLRGTQIVDISHDLAPWNFFHAAYVGSSLLPHFEAGTVHIVLVSVFENNRAEVVVARHKDQWLVCPNNGLVTMILGYKPVQFSVLRQPTDESAMHLLSYTQFIARQLAALQQQQWQLNAEGLGNLLVEKYPLRPTLGPDWMEGQIIYIDQFENVVVNISRLEFETQRAGRNINIQFARHTITYLSHSYASVQPGEMVAWFNSSGYLELALNKGNMAGLIGLQGIGAGQSNIQNKPSFYYSTVRIYFVDPNPATS